MVEKCIFLQYEGIKIDVFLYFCEKNLNITTGIKKKK
jgi:hypothetical protein